MQAKKRVLYISNIEVPYRDKFFNEFSKECDLTVLYERRKSSNRDSAWTDSGIRNYKAEYLDGIKIKSENAFSFRIFKYVFGKYDCIIIGCYNSPVQMMAILAMRIFQRPYILSIDGEQFVDLSTCKGKLKAFFLRGANRYLAAGEKSVESLRKIVGSKEVIPYYFSSLTEEEIKNHAQRGRNVNREDFVLVVGQYYEYKGMDVAVEAAAMDSKIRYKFVGMGKRTDLFIKETGADKLSNVEIIPFLQKDALEEEYLKCAVMILPSRQECWGLVINEAASFGTPIVSTWGSGAAVEFLADDYPQYLAKPGDAEDLYEKIKLVNRAKGACLNTFKNIPIKKYSINAMVVSTLNALNC